jgi:hypothetical protein
MIEPRSRSTIFRTSPYTDHRIATMQQAYASDFDLTDKKDAACVKQHYDHLQPLHSKEWPQEQHFVLAWEAEDIKQYEQGMGGVLHRFLSQLGISQLYLLDPLYEPFPFESFSKRNAFRRLTGSTLDHMGFLLDTYHLGQLLPLLLFSGIYGRPVVYFVSAYDELPLAFSLCDDGNFHATCLTTDYPTVKEAAEKSGLITGDIELCAVHSIYILRNTYYQSK